MNPKYYFNPSIEWNLNPRDMFDSLGVHNCNCNLSSTKHIGDNVSMTIFPNPANDQLFVNTSMDVQSLSVFAANGQIIPVRWEVKENNQIQLISLDLSKLNEGIYTIELKSVSGQSLVRRFMK